jgi:hypothetical protein
MASWSTALPLLSGQQQTGIATASLLNTGGVQEQQQTQQPMQQQVQQQLHQQHTPPLFGTPHQENRTTNQEHHTPIAQPRTCTPHQQQLPSNGFIVMDVDESAMQVRTTEDAILQGKFN